MSLAPISSSEFSSRVLTLHAAAVEQEGVPALRAVMLEGREAINELFEYRLLVQTAELGLGAAPWNTDAALLLERELGIHLELDGDGVLCDVVRQNPALAQQHSATDLHRRVSALLAALDAAGVQAAPKRHRLVEQALDHEDELASVVWLKDEIRSPNHPLPLSMLVPLPEVE